MLLYIYINLPAYIYVEIHLVRILQFRSPRMVDLLVGVHGIFKLHVVAFS